MEPTGQILKALNFAAQKHRDQRRKDPQASPYINHPIALAHLLWEVGITDAQTITAALLHDTVEDTATTFTELAQTFGAEIADLVAELTDDKTLPKQTRKALQIQHAAELSDRAKLVKLADKICNLREVLNSPPADWSLQRRQDYMEWCKQVVDRIRGTNSALETQFDRLYQQGTEQFAAKPKVLTE